MNSTTIYLFPTVLLFALLLLAVRRAINPDSAKELWRLAYTDPDRDRLPSPAVLGCLFSTADLAFIMAEQCKPLLSLFLEDRRRIAVSWLTKLKAEVIAAVRQHRRVSRTSSDFRPKAELSLAISLLQFSLMYLFLSALLRFYSPFVAKKFTFQLRRVSEQLSTLQNAIRFQAGSGIVTTVG